MTDANRHGVDDEIPLTASQHMLRFFDMLYPGSAFGPDFTICAGFRISGPVDRDALDASVQDAVRRHDALRTVVVLGKGVPFQRVVDDTPPARFAVSEIDLDPTERDQFVRDILTAADGAQHAITDLPLVSTHLYRFAVDDSLFVMITHHAAGDATSNEIFMRDVAAYYTARTTGSSPVLPEPFTPHSVCARLEQSPERERRREASLRYWSTKLDGVPVAALPADRAGARSPQRQQRVVRFEIDGATTGALTAVARDMETTMFVVLLATYALVHHTLTGAVDFAVPTLMSARGRPETRNTVGFFVDARLLRVQLDGDPTIGEIGDRLRATCAEAVTRDAPILRVLEAVSDAAMLVADEHFLFMPFQYVPFQRPGANSLGPGAVYEPLLHPANDASRMAHPLDGLWTMRLHETLVGDLAYGEDLFDRETIIAMSKRFIAALDLVIEQRHLSLSKATAKLVEVSS